MSENEILTLIEGHYSVVNLRKLTRKTHNLDVVMVNAYAKFDQIPSIRLQHIERKRILTLTKGHNSIVKLQKHDM